MSKNTNQEKTFTVKLSLITIVFTIIFFVITIVSVGIRSGIEELPKEWKIVLDCIIIIFPILVSALGISLFLEATSYRKVLQSEFKTALESLLTGEKQAEYLSKATFEQMFQALQIANLRELNPNIKNQDITPISVDFRNIIKQLINGVFIEKDKRDIVIRIEKNKIIKTLTITQIFRNKYKIPGFNEFYMTVECVDDSEIKLNNFLINNKPTNTRPIKVQQYEVHSESSYSSRYEIRETFEIQDKNTIKMEWQYDIPLEDSTSYFVNRYLCKQLEHTITVISDEPVDFEVTLFALNNNNKHDEDCKYYIDSVAQEGNVKSTKKTRVIKFLDWSFPGDGYGFNIKR